jgi:hypothetical protein
MNNSGNPRAEKAGIGAEVAAAAEVAAVVATLSTAIGFHLSTQAISYLLHREVVS